MKAKEKRARVPRPLKREELEQSGVFVVPSHGRLARRGSTEIVEDHPGGRGSARERQGEPSS
jgi:hypothetical protein